MDGVAHEGLNRKNKGPTKKMKRRRKVSQIWRRKGEGTKENDVNTRNI